MRTWSIAGFIDKLRALEHLTRPPRMGHDVDVPIPSPHCDCGITDDMGDLDKHSATCSIWHDGANPSEPLTTPAWLKTIADQTASAAMDDVFGPAAARRIQHARLGYAGCGRDMESYAEGFNEGFAEAQQQQDPDWKPDDTPNPYEPSLTDDELVAVRGLIQERYGVPEGATPLDPEVAMALVNAMVESGQDMGARLESAAAFFPQHTKTPNPSSVASAAPDDSPAEVSEPPKPSPSAGQPTWVDAAIPVITEVLAEHQARELRGGLACQLTDGRICGWPDSTHEWRAHVSAIIAEALESHRVYPKRGPMGERVDVVLKPEK